MPDSVLFTFTIDRFSCSDVTATSLWRTETSAERRVCLQYTVQLFKRSSVCPLLKTECSLIRMNNMSLMQGVNVFVLRNLADGFSDDLLL